MARAYDMRRRAERAAGTRTAIIAAAQRLLARSDATTLSLLEVAAEAEVSRATIYNSIGSRAQVLAAVFENQGHLIEFDRVLGAMRHPDPAVAVIGAIRESCRAWSVMPEAIRRTLALAVIDPEIDRLVRRYEGFRRDEIAALARRLPSGRGGRSRRARANRTAMLALLTSFQAFDQIQRAQGTSQATDVLIALATAAFDLGQTPQQPPARTAGTGVGPDG